MKSIFLDYSILEMLMTGITEIVIIETKINPDKIKIPVSPNLLFRNSFLISCVDTLLNLMFSLVDQNNHTINLR